MSNTNSIINSRAFEVVKNSIDNREPLDIEVLFNKAEERYKTGKHKSPYIILKSIEKSLQYFIDKGIIKK